ncbi:MAG TPA: hypothetical protein VGD67_23010 [Pseudonocardiaceae bacterium]
MLDLDPEGGPRPLGCRPLLGAPSYEPGPQLGDGSREPIETVRRKHGDTLSGQAGDHIAPHSVMNLDTSDESGSVQAGPGRAGSVRQRNGQRLAEPGECPESLPEFLQRLVGVGVGIRVGVIDGRR